MRNAAANSKSAMIGTSRNASVEFLVQLSDILPMLDVEETSPSLYGARKTSDSGRARQLPSLRKTIICQPTIRNAQKIVDISANKTVSLVNRTRLTDAVGWGLGRS